MKPGDHVMAGPLILAHEIECGDYGSVVCEYAVARTTNGDGVTPDGAGFGEYAPWHPALPALAKWLATRPDDLGVNALLVAIGHYLEHGPHTPGLDDDLDALYAALEPFRAS